MRIEDRREFAMPLGTLWDYTLDFAQWPMWYADMLEVVEPEKASWAGVGDQVRVAQKLLGRRVEITVTAREWKDHDLVLFEAEAPGLPSATQRWDWRALDDGHTELVVTMETEEPTSLFGKIVDKALVPGIYRRWLTTSLDNIEALVRTGLPDATTK